MRKSRTAAWLACAVIPCLAPFLWMTFNPQPAYAQSDAPDPQTVSAVYGTAKDASGAVIAGAIVTLEATVSANQRTTITDQAGAFRFSPLEPGNYKVTITAGGFAAWTANVAAGSGENQPLSAILQVAPASSSMDVGLPPHELAAQQLKTEEKQRLIGVFPNYFVSYEPDPAPLTAAQKFQLGWKTVIDPVVLLDSGISAGLQQWRNSYHEFGQGMEGYGKRFGAQYADGVNGIIIGSVLTQAVFHQDPRYFYKGTGGVRSRVLYAIATAFVRKGDNGHWQPDYSDVLGSLAAAEISTLYYPASSRTGLRLFHDVLGDMGGRVAGNLMQQFVYRKFTPHTRKTMAGPSQPILREGTPVSLISVEDLSSKTAANAGPVAFVLAGDIQVGGTTVAKAGSTASGQASYGVGPGGASGSDTGAMHMGLGRVRLRVGNADVPLRSSQVRGGDGALQYHRLENSGRIAIVLYVAQNIALPPAQ